MILRQVWLTIWIVAVFSTFSLKAMAREVEFSWDAVEGVKAYEVQVASDEKFTKVVTTKSVDKPVINTQLGIGKYFYRVRVVDLKGRPGRWSPPQSVLVTPYSAELLEPKDGYKTEYFEVLPTIKFSWKPVDGNPEYEILISKSTGQKVLEAKTAETSFSTNKIAEGEYNWKVRTITQKEFLSQYTDSRKFSVIRKPLQPPKLIKPAQNEVLPAYRQADFEWTQDPNTHFTDLTLEKISGPTEPKKFKNKISNLGASTYHSDYLETGKYKWLVTTKEAKDTPGLTSETQDFDVRNDMISDGQYELEFSISPFTDLYTTTSTFQSMSNSNVLNQQSGGAGTFYGFFGGYYFWKSFGIFFSSRTAKTTIENLSTSLQESEASMRIRMGVAGFAQEFYLGYRIQDIIEAENNPAQQSTQMTALGAVLGTRLTATVAQGWKVQGTASYFKPTSNVEGITGLTADSYQFSIGAKWNFIHQFWLGYRAQFLRVNAGLASPADSAINSSWTQYRTEPFNISISYEH